MKSVKYKGNADVRTITSDDWSSVGVSSKDAEWVGYGDTQEIANAAADYLLAHNPLEFEVAGEDPDPEAVRAAEREVASGTGGETGVRGSIGGTAGTAGTTGGTAGTAGATTTGGATGRTARGA